MNGIKLLVITIMDNNHNKNYTSGGRRECMPVVSVSMPESLLSELDAFIAEHDYSGRSEAVREGARELLGQGQTAGRTDEKTICITTVAFDHNADVTLELSAVRRSHSDLVVSNLHSHAGGYCLELFVLEGTDSNLHSFLAQLRRVDGIEWVEHTPLTHQPSLASSGNSAR